MKFLKVLKEGRGYSIHTIISPYEIKRNKYELLKAYGLDVTFDFNNDELLVAKPNGDIINIFSNTGAVRFEYKNEIISEKWKKLYSRLFPNEGKRVSTYTKKDGTINKKSEKRHDPSDFLKNAYLRQKLIEYGDISYQEFMQEMAKDIRALFV